MTNDDHLQTLLGDLLAVCEKFARRMGTEGSALLTAKARATHEVVMDEPYVPYLPSASSTILVLAESQNLSTTNEDYVGWLKRLDATGKFRRILDGKLDGSGELGIQPWDDGTLKLAVRAALGVDPATVAVSNAVPWSWVKGDANARPFTKKVLGMASDFWSDIFEKWKPERIVAAGAVARKVMKGALSTPHYTKVVEWALPSPRLDPAGKMFNPADLMERFQIEHDVRSAVLAADEHIIDRLAFYVCHAVSRMKL